MKISLTERAQAKIKSLIEKSDGRIGIRPGVRGGGCSGFQYTLEFVETEIEDLTQMESGGVKIFVDRKSLLYLSGTEIDYVDDLNQSGFKFNNPSAKRTCGCGESFSV